MIDGGMTATSDANFDDLYAHYMGRNGDPATQYDYELKEAVRAAYKAILKNKVQSGSDFNALPESGGDQYDDMEWGNTDSGEVRPPTDEEYDRAKDQLSTVSDGNIGSIGVDDGTGLMYVMTDDGEEYEIGHNQITYMGNEFSEGAELAGLLEAAGVKHLKGKDKIKGSGVKGYDEPHPTKGKFVGENDVEEAIIPWDSEHSDGDFVDDETGQIHRNEDVIQDPETGEWREKTQQERIGPERWAELERKDAEDKAAWNDWDSDAEEDQWNIEYRKMNWDAIGDFGDVAGGGGDPIDYVMQKYGLSMDDIDAEAQNQGFSDGHEWASSYSEEGTLESVNEDDPWALGEAGGESRYEQEARDNVERHLGDLGIEDPDELGQEAWTLAYDGALDAGATPDYATQIANKVGQEYGLADGSHLAYESDDPWALGYDDESVSDDDYVIPDEGNDTDWVIPNEDIDAIADDLLAEYGEDEFERGDDWGDDDMYDDVEETSVTIKGDLPAKSYWNKTGKHQDKSEKLETLIPASDEVEDYKNNPALENFRRLANIYHDVYNNGFWDEGMGQRGDEMEEYFGWGPGQTISTDDLEDMVSKNTLAAWREQSKKGTLEETMSGAFATGAMREDDEEDEYFDDEERADMASDADRDSMIDIMGDDIVLTPGQIVRVSSELGGEAAVVAQRDNYIVVNLPRGGMKLLRNDEWWLEDHEDSGEYIDVDYSEDDPEELHFESKKKISNEGFGRRYVPHQHSHEEDKRLFKQQELQHELRGEEGINNYAIFIGGKHWKTVKNERHAGAIVNSLKKKGKDAEYRYGAFPMNETMTIKSITSPKLKLTRQIKAYFPHDDLDEIYGWMKSAEEYGQPLTVDEYADWRSMDDEGNPKTEGASTFKKGPKMKGGGYNKPNKPKQKKAASKAGRQADKKAMDEGYKIMPPMDPKYIERDGLEGPFTTHSGKVVYYDPKAGKHYDPDTDMYMDYDEYAEYDRNPDMEYPEYTIPAPKPKERGRMDERWTDEDDGDYAYDNWKDKEMEKLATSLVKKLRQQRKMVPGMHRAKLKKHQEVIKQCLIVSE
jgi:hypothetical protein